ncbi:MAG: integrase [Gammaproteobacteria bacterium]|uniref:Integron integrase IntIPac n=1 Tax=Marinobacter nitratireducens TaxID=1137280 RepID=A0A072N673_9GAMM|nr:site-specific integrase [Marinobacter nitratireducens]KEF33011.1 Integron integrase IntIPac [Marinobacter nitratireducens]TNE75880.1 MAG: integrase [Gammaproteobacteria bacterium]TNE94079.1 MAG: integrase [Gammaproteobacteria bacterium]
MDITEALEQSQPGLVGRVRVAIRNQQLNQRAEQNYLHWITRFVLFHDMKDPETLAGEDRQQFLSYLSDRIRVSRARLNQASQALTFFYEDVLGKASVSGTTVAA